MISLYDILEASNGQLFGEPASQLFSQFAFDVRQVQSSSLFVAIKGDYGDTHQDIEAAIKQGAVGVLCSQPPSFDTSGISVIVVKDTVAAVLSWSKFVLERFSTQIIVVTGTSERSTTAATIAKVLGISYSVHHAFSNYGRLSLPLALANLDPSHDFVILEFVANKPNELKQLREIVQPDFVVMTHLGEVYLNQFESHEQIIEEHRQFLASLSADDVVFLNYDYDHIRTFAADTPAKSQTFSIDGFGADVMAYNLIIGPTRTGFDIRYRGERYVGRWVPLLGRQKLYSTLAALSVGLHFDIALESSLRALTEVEPLSGYMNTFIGKQDCIVIDDTASANPETTMAALDWLHEVRDDETRVILVLGDMDNLGDSSRLIHRRIGQYAASIADVIITEGAQAAFAGRAAQDVVGDEKQVFITYSLRDTLATLNQIQLNPQDIVLVKGDSSAYMELAVKNLLVDSRDHARLVRQNQTSVLMEQPERPLQPSWVEIDREAVAQNVRFLKRQVGDDVTLVATVKANAYGHGAITVSRIALQNGAGYLAVASIREALELRDAGIDAPILVLSYTPVYAIREAVRHHITVTVYDLDLARAYNQVAQELGQTLKIHVKVDSGMGRMGVLTQDAVGLFRYLLNMSHIEIEGIFTHFSVADEDTLYTDQQVKTFRSVLVPLRAAGIKFKYVHVSNSAGLLLGKDYHFNMVRAGILLYGCSASGLVEKPSELKPLMTWKTAIAQVKTLPAGHPIGYGNTYTTRTDEKVAVIPVGYADGFRRGPQKWPTVLVHGQRAPILGRVSMEKTVISVNHLDSVAIGDEVVLLGTQGDQTITAEEIAEEIGTISYEVLTNVLPRVPRH